MPEPCSAEIGKSACTPRRRKFSACGKQLVGVDLVDGEEDRLAGADEQAREFDVGRSELGAAVHDHDDGCASSSAVRAWRKISAGMRLGIVRDDAAGIDEARGAAGPFDFAVDAVAGDAGLVADDGAAASR